MYPTLIARVLNGRRISALLLLALWLPAMLHCRLEAAGLLFGADCCAAAPDEEQTHTDTATDCAGDSCEIAEGDFTAPSAFVLKAPSTESCAQLFFLAVTPVPAVVSAAPLNGVAKTTAAPRELTVPWVLVTRGPRSPRAP